MLNYSVPALIRVGVDTDAPALAAFAARTFEETFAADNCPEDLRVHLAKAFGVPQQAVHDAARRLRDPIRGSGLRGHFTAGSPHQITAHSRKA